MSLPTAAAGAARKRPQVPVLLGAGVLAMLLLASLLSLSVPMSSSSLSAWPVLAGTVLMAVPWWLAMALLAVLVAVLDPGHERVPGSRVDDADPGSADAMADAGKDPEPDPGPDGQPLSARIPATALITLGHGVVATLVLTWPLQWALAAPSLGTFLMTATAVLVIVLAPLALWPAPFLPALARHARGLEGVRPLQRLRRAAVAARALTAEAGGDRGLIVLWLYSACLLLPVLAVAKVSCPSTQNAGPR